MMTTLPPTSPMRTTKLLSAHPIALLFAIMLLLHTAATNDARAQFTFATDNAGNYGGSWSGGSDGGSGFGAWTLNAGANSGGFIGNPANNGISTNGMGTTAFGMFATGSEYFNATRSFDVGMGIGDSFTFDWGMNWDANTGAKGFDLRAGGSTIFNVNNGGSSTITAGGANANTDYGTGNMLVTLTRTSTGYTFSMTSRSGGSTYTTNISTSSTIDGINFYIGNQNDGNGNRNIYFNDLSITNSGVFSQGGTVTNANTFSGSGALSIGNNTTLVLSGGGNNNYTGATTISNGSTLVFAGSGTSQFASTIGGGTGNVVMSNASGTVLLTNNNTYSGNTTIAAGTLLIGHANALGSTGTISVNTGSRLQLSNSITFTRGITLTNDGIGGSGALQSVSGNNTWSGNITNNGGSTGGARINADSGSSLTIGGNITSGANTLYIGGAGNTTVNGTISGSATTGNGALYKDGSGVLSLTNNNSSLTGLVRLLGGTISITNNNSLGSGTFELGGLGTQAILSVGTNTSRSQTLLIQNASTNSVINVASGSVFTVTGSLTQDGALANTTKFGKTGAGTLVLAGTSGNTYNGQIQIGQGTVIAGTASSLGVNNSTANRGIDLGLNITDVSQGNSVAVLASNGVTISNSFYVSPNTSSALRTIGLSGSGSATFNNEFYMDGTLTVDAGANASDLVTMSGNILNTGGISKTNVGILVLSGSGNTFSGGVTLGSGTLRVGANSALGTGTFAINGGTFASSSSAARTITNNTTMGGNVTLGDATGTGGLTLSNINLAGTTRTFTVGNNTTVAGVISNGSGTPGLTKAGSGTMTLSGANTFSGVTTVNAGVLSVGAANNLGANPGSGVTNQLTLNGGALAVTAGFTANANAGITIGSSGGTVDVAASQRLIQGGGFYGTGNFTKTGQGTLSLTNTAGGYAGAITVTNGTLQANTSLRGANISLGNSSTVNGSVLMGSGSVGTVSVLTNGRISPGNSVGTLSVSNTLTFGSGGSYLWEINGTNGPSGTTWDLITVDTTATTNGLGTLLISNPFTINGLAIDGFSFNGSQNYTNNYFEIVRAANIAGALTNISLSMSGLGTGDWSLSTNSTGLYLNYNAPGTIWVFNNSSAADQGAASITTNGNTLGQLAVITNGASPTAVTISNSAPVIFTNANNSYSGATLVEQGTLVAAVDSANAANGAFGNASTTVQVGSTNTGNSAAATLLIGNPGVTVGRGITVNSGGTGARTIGATNASGTATYSGNIAANTNVTLSASNSGGTTLFSGVLSGSGAVTAAGSGQVVLSGANTYTNTTTVSSNSTLLAANNSALGGGSGATTVNNGGTLAFSNNISEDEVITISGTGVGGNGALRSASGDNTNTGTVSLGANATVAAVSGASLTLSNVDTATSDRNLTVSANGTVRILGSILTAGSITNVLQKDGAGNLIVSNSGTTGGIQLQVGNGSVTLAAGSFSTNTSTVGSSVSPRAIDLGISSTGDSANNVAFYANSGVTVSNSFYVAPNASSATRTIGTESTGGTATFTSEIYLGGSAHLFANTGGTALFSGNFVNSGNLVKVGDGTVRLSGNNTIGSVTISNGTLAITNGSAIPSTSLVTIEGPGTLSVLSTENMGRIAGTGIITVASGQTLTNTISDSATFGGQLQGAGVIRKAGVGSLTLTGSTSNSISRFEHEEGVLIMGTNTGIASVYQAQFDTAGTKTIAASGANSFTLSQSNNIYNNLTIGQTSGNTGSLTFSGGTFLGDAGSRRELTVNGTHTFSGAVTGQLGMTKLGSGSLTLSGNNTFQGGVQHDLGTLIVGNNAALGTGTYQVQFDVAGTKTIAANGTSAFTLSQSNNIFNNLTIGESAGNTGSLTFSGGTFLGDTGSARILTVNGTHTFSGTVTGALGMVKSGAGSLILSGSNAFTGGLFIDQGVLDLTGGSLAAGAIEIGGGVAGGAVNASNAVLRVSTNGTFTRTITVNADTNATGVSGSRSLEFANSGGTATLSGNVTLEKTVAADVSNANAVGALSGNISGAGGLTKAGSGSLVLSGSNSFTGNVTISNGTIALTNGNAIGNNPLVSIDSGGTMAVLSSETLGRFTGAGAVNIASGQTLTTDYANASNSFAGQISGVGGLIKAGTGTLTLSGSNSFTGLMQLNEGTVLVGNANALGAGTVQVQFDEAGTRTIASSSGAGFALANNVNIYNNVTIGQSSGGTGSLDFSGTVALGDPTATNNRNVTINGSQTFSGAVTGSNSLTKLGLGTLTLSGASANTFTGGAVISAGTLNLNKAVDVTAIAGPITVGNGAVLLLSSSGNVANTAAVTLSGGTIARGAGVSEVFGNLNITAASFLNFGSGTEGDFQFQTYANTGSALVTVQNFLQGNRLQFLSASFNAGNLSQFTFDNAYTTSIQGDYFTITAIPEPSTYFAAAGLLALFLWPARRRLIKDAKSILGLRAPARDRVEAYRNA